MVQVMPPIKAKVSNADMEDLMSAYSAEKSGGAHAELGRQFTPYTGGPAEAKEATMPAFRSRHGLGTPEEEDPEGHPPRLFDPETVARPEAHQQTPDQFAADPRTWWHGRVTKGGVRSSLGGSGVGRGEGFHAGTEGAARQRVTQNIKRRGLKEGMAGHLYPLRITGPVEGPENMKEDLPKHRELGPRSYGSWGGQSYGGRSTGYLYENKVENVGSISVGVPQRKGFMSTQREMVKTAQQRGNYVHPNIAWAAKAAPEHTAENIQEVRRYGNTPPQGHQQGLHEQFKQSGREFSGGMGDPRRLQSFKELYPQPVNTHRTSYTTESGRRKNVYAFSTDQPGSALLSKQWQPSS
jgi:hypothetical protein